MPVKCWVSHPTHLDVNYLIEPTPYVCICVNIYIYILLMLWRSDDYGQISRQFHPSHRHIVTCAMSKGDLSTTPKLCIHIYTNAYALWAPYLYMHMYDV